MARRRIKRRSARRTYRRDAHGRFAPTGTVASQTTQRQRKRRRRAAVAGTAVAVGALAGSQARPTSRTRTGVQRRRIVRRHVARAASDYEHLAHVRARAFPTTALSGAAFDRDAATREGKRLTEGYRKQVRSQRKARRISR